MFRTVVTTALLPAILAVPVAALADEPAPTAAPAPVAAAAETPAPAPAPEAPAVAQATGNEAPPEAVAAPTGAPPEADVTEEAKEAPPVTLNLFASTAYSFNFNRPVGGQNQLRVFDTEDASARVDAVEVVLQRPVSAPGDAGFRFDLVAGSSIPHISAAMGLFRDHTTGAAQDFDIQQAYASYVAKVGDGLRIDAGKFITHMGLEVIEGYDGYNDNYSRSMLFGYTIPFTHTGLRVSTPFGAKATGTLLLVNGWDNVKDNNERPSLGLQLALVPSPKVSLWLNYIGGPEGASNSALRHVGNVVGVFAVTDKVTLSVDTVFGTEADVVDTDGDMTGDASASWYGAAGYAKLQATDSLALTLRGEWFSDADGARTGADQDLVSVTLTPTFKLASAFVVRGDLRLDHSSADSFITDDMASPSANQFTVAANVIAIY